MLHGDCLMEAGRCDEGRKVVRDYYAKPNPNPMLAMSSTASRSERIVDRADVLPAVAARAARARAARADAPLRAQSSNDTTTKPRTTPTRWPRRSRSSRAARTTIATKSRRTSTASGRRTATRAAATRRKNHFRSQCSINSPHNVDNCSNSLLNKDIVQEHALIVLVAFARSPRAAERRDSGDAGTDASLDNGGRAHVHVPRHAHVVRSYVQHVGRLRRRHTPLSCCQEQDEGIRTDAARGFQSRSGRAHRRLPRLRLRRPAARRARQQRHLVHRDVRQRFVHRARAVITDPFRRTR